MDSSLLERIERGTTTAADAAALREKFVILAHQIADAAAYMDELNIAQIILPRDIGRRHADNAQVQAQARQGPVAWNDGLAGKTVATE